MRLKKYTDYALRVLIYTASSEDKVSIKEISESFFISAEHIRKVVHQLSKHDYIETTRGRNGGIRLHKNPEDINLGEVIRLMENDFYLVECFNCEVNRCILTPSCSLRSILADATQAFLTVLDQYTLKDLIVNKEDWEDLFRNM
ncbi:Rrf2 family nitric oxide-sensitive transcriptional repressor [Gracilibacillus halotolerans]|uniref:HTH-type transcriptional regulator NsrR n=1 Tax=Gracilibacillus halotolerans TaxID=74386 RepID=A0A841RI18_9BACI|nr:Rrf2 family transcriptional regulator [Gracilibacillus halotolerans]MBB6511507.1 Rrf2 family nitric oxide-sensitive transcriptional repressor [Gracilibacillus halotolerans]